MEGSDRNHGHTASRNVVAVRIDDVSTRVSDADIQVGQFNRRADVQVLLVDGEHRNGRKGAFVLVVFPFLVSLNYDFLRCQVYGSDVCPYGYKNKELH